MGWIKRNLFFVVGGFVALGLLGADGFYDYVSWGYNQDQFIKLSEVSKALRDLANPKPSPGNDKINNIEIAKQQEAQLREWIRQTTNYFQPIAPVPRPANRALSSDLFGSALNQTIVQLQHEAAAKNVALPPQCNFSFTAHMGRITFAPGTLEPLAVQLGEVKTICELLFTTGINALDGIQRIPVSPDDAGGPQADYLAEPKVTTELGEMVPYQVTFRGFSPEIARVLEAFAASPHGFIITALNVQPAGAASGSATSASAADAGAPSPTTGKGGLQTVLNEQLLRVTLTVEVVKLTPRN